MTVFWAILAILFIALSGGLLYSINLYRQKNRKLIRQLKQKAKAVTNLSAVSNEEFQKLKQENLMYQNALNEVRNSGVGSQMHPFSVQKKPAAVSAEAHEKLQQDYMRLKHIYEQMTEEHRKMQSQVSAGVDSSASNDEKKMQMMKDVVRKCKKDMEEMQQKAQTLQKHVQDLQSQLREQQRLNQSQANEVKQLNSALQFYTAKSSDAKDSQQKLAEDLQNRLRKAERMNYELETEREQYRAQLSAAQQAKADSDDALQKFKKENTKMQQQEQALLRQVQELQNQLQNQTLENQRCSAEVHELEKMIQMYKAEAESAQKAKSAYADLEKRYQALMKEQECRTSRSRDAAQLQTQETNGRYAEYYRTLCMEPKALAEISSVEFLSASVSLSGELMLSLSSNYRSAQVAFLASSGELLPNPYCFSHFASDGETMQSLDRLESVFEIRTPLYPECRYTIKKIIPAKCQRAANEYTLLEKGMIWLEEI